MTQKRDGVYIWVTWLSKLMAGEQSCEWASWFKANYEYYEKVPSDFDTATWQVDHTRLLRDMRIERQRAGGQVFFENQNKFTYKTPNGIAVAGKPDMIELLNSNQGIIYDAKTGQKMQSNLIQVMLYIYLLPLARIEWKNTIFDGAVQYKDTKIEIPASAIDDAFKDNVDYFINILASSTPPEKVPSDFGCRFCDIHKQECPERIQ